MSRLKQRRQHPIKQQNYFFLHHHHTQGPSPRRVAVEGLFHPALLELFKI